MALTIDQWNREMPARMDAKSHLLHAPMRQYVPTSPELVAKRRRAEERKLLRELPGDDGLPQEKEASNATQKYCSQKRRNPPGI